MPWPIVSVRVANPVEPPLRIVLAMRLALPVALLVSLALAGCGSDSEEAATTGQASAGQTIEIGETEFALDPANVDVDETGRVTFRVTTTAPPAMRSNRRSRNR